MNCIRGTGNLIHNCFILQDKRHGTHHCAPCHARVLLYQNQSTLFPFTDTTDHVAVFNGGFHFLHTGLQLSEAIGHGETEELTVLGIDVVTPTDDVTLRGAGLVVQVFMEWV